MPPNAGRDASIVVADSISESDGVEIEPTDRRRGSSEPMPDAGDAPIETRAPGAEAGSDAARCSLRSALSAHSDAAGRRRLEREARVRQEDAGARWGGEEPDKR